MSVYDEELWKLMKRKAEQEDADRPADRATAGAFVEGVREVCEFGITRAMTIRDTFPLYTLHDETHICNVLRLMHDLLGERACQLTRDEAAMLVICACCHDVGMSYTEDEKSELLKDHDKIDEYLNRHPKEYVRAYAEDADKPDLDDAIRRNFFRSIHHERVRELLQLKPWPDALVGRVDCDDVVSVCESHGNDVATLRVLDSTDPDVLDLRMCAVLLRLADILDFDDSRTPKALYEYCGFATSADAEAKVSDQEWQKHLSSRRFKFPSAKKRKHPYELKYSTSCKDPQVEQGVRSYLDWVDKELRECARELADHTGRWQGLVLPQSVKRNIKSVGYESGSYRLTLDQNKVIDLLVGNDLYADRSVFVRELIQNAIDAGRTRKALDNSLPPDWEPSISIRTWTDNEGYNWFSIKDNGVGMTRQTILNHLLKVGSSYYESDAFRQEKLRHASPDYTPISRFGIGILSCFMANDESAQVEISTKHYEGTSGLRLSINGTNGFYRLCRSEKHYPDPGPMKDIAGTNRYGYLREAGTAIAVRTNLYALGIYGGFRQVVDKYVAFPPVAVHYEDIRYGGAASTFDYPTERDLVARTCGMGPGGDEPTANVVDLPVPASAVEQIQSVWPEFRWPKDFKVQLGCLPLGTYAKSPHVTGVAVAARTVGRFPTFTHRFGTQEIEMGVSVHLDPMVPYLEGSPTIRIGIQIQPAGADADAINDIISEYKQCVYFDDLVAQHTRGEDSCLAAIFDALRSPGVLDRSWRASIQERFERTNNELEQELEHTRAIICEHTGLTPEQVDLAMRLSPKRDWHVEVCDLSSLGWYTSLFGASHARTGHHMLVAHNGIACGSANGLFCDDDSQCVAAALLLKDKLRPNLGLARDGIRSYTLETQLVLELMRRRMQADGFHLGEDHLTSSADHPLLAADAYEDVLANNEELARELVLTVEGGAEVRIDELARTRQAHKLATSFAPLLMWDDDPGTLARCYRRFCLARAQQVCTIRARFHDPGYFVNKNGTWLYPKEADNLPQGYRLFPPAFFALPLSSEDTCLTIRDARRRHHINATHKLARFLLKNAHVLHDRAPGILMDITRCLAEDDGDALVGTVNELLKCLRKLPKGPKSPLNVPDDLKLDDTDLY